MDKRPDIVFLALHGSWGENGEIQAALDMFDIKYTGSSFEASCLAMNKYATKSILKNMNIPAAEAVLLKDKKDLELIDFYPICIKPNKEGSSVGVEFADNNNEAILIFDKLEKYGELVAEKKINGRELTVTVLNSEAYPIIEIKPKQGFYDYKNKYTKGATEYITPAELPKNIEKKCMDAALSAYKAIGCSGCARVDIMLENDTPYVLEVNTIPGMTETSLVPKAARVNGVEFSELVKLIVEG